MKSSLLQTNQSLLRMLHSRNTYTTIHIYTRKHSQYNNDEGTRFFRKTYLSFYSKGLRKGLCVRGELETEQKLQHIDPLFLCLLQHFFLVLMGCSTGDPEGPAFCRVWFSLPQTATTESKLTQTSCGAGLYNCLTSACFSERRICTQLNPSIVKVNFRYLRPDAPVIYTGAFLIWQLGRVGGQYVTRSG